MSESSYCASGGAAARQRLFERTVLDSPQVSTALRQSQSQTAQHSPNACLLDFLHFQSPIRRLTPQPAAQPWPRSHRTRPRLCYIDFEFPAQVGGQDLALDLVFCHRGMNCLVAIELEFTGAASNVGRRDATSRRQRWGPRRAWHGPTRWPAARWRMQSPGRSADDARPLAATRTPTLGRRPRCAADKACAICEIRLQMRNTVDACDRIFKA